MEPVSSIVIALATGAAAALKPAAEQLVKDAYSGLKTMLRKKYGRVSVDMLETDPASEARQSVIKEDLTKTGAADDPEVLDQAKTLLDLIAARDPSATAAAGVNLEDVKGASLKISDIISSGTGVKARKVEVSGDIEIKGVRAGDLNRPPPNPPERQ